jgi:hypothetical protein
MDGARWMYGIALAAFAAAGLGCSGFPGTYEDEEENPGGYPAEVQDMVVQIDRLQARGELREAIDRTEIGLIDYPNVGVLQVRLAELRSQRQVCFDADWSEADALCGRNSSNSAVVVLRRIEKYGDRDMVQRARDRIGEIRAGHPEI